MLRSLKDRLRSSFNVSVAELDPTDLWQSATLGVVAISSSRHYLEGLMKQVESAATRIANNHGAEITDSYFLDFLRLSACFPAPRFFFCCPATPLRTSASNFR